MPADLIQLLKEMREQCEKATKGPWRYVADDEGSSMGWIECDRQESPHGGALFDVNGDSAQQCINAAFITRSRTLVPALLSVVEVAVQELKAARRSHYECDGDCWFSCPKSGKCCNDEADTNQCNCGADYRNAAIDNALSQITTLLTEATK